MSNHITQLFHRQSSIMRVLTDIDSACQKSMPPHLSVECKIAETRVSGKPTIIVHEKMFEVIVDSDCNWWRSYKVSSSSRKQCWKGTRDVVLCVEFIDGCPTARRPWYCWGWLMRSLLTCRLSDGLLLCMSLSGQYWGQKFLQGGHYKDLRRVETGILGQLPVYPSSAVTSFFSPRGLHLPHLLRWLVLIHYNLASFPSGVSCSCRSFVFTGTFPVWPVACLSLAVWAVRLARSLSLRFLNCLLLCSTVSAARRALSLTFLRRRRSSCSCADLRALLGLLWVSMLNKTCRLNRWL